MWGAHLAPFTPMTDISISTGTATGITIIVITTMVAVTTKVALRKTRK